MDLKTIRIGKKGFAGEAPDSPQGPAPIPTDGKSYRVLFTNPPWYKEPSEGKKGWRGVRAGSRWPHTFEYVKHEVVDGKIPDLVGGYLPFPFWLATAGAYAKRRGFEAYTRDSIALGETYDSYFEFLEAYRPDIVVLETASATLKHDLDLVGRMRAFLPDLKVVLTGLHIELETPEFLASHPLVNFVCYGEYEESCILLLEALRAEKPLESVPGLVFRKADGSIGKTDFGKLVALDELPWAEREDGLPALHYYDGVCGLPRPQLQLMSTRGCPYGCIFCVWPQMFYKSGKYRRRTPKDVVDEIESNFKKVPYKSFYIDDDTFNMAKKTVIELAQLIRERGLQTIPWGTMGRADRIDDEQLDALVAAGLYSIKYGVESADQAILDAADKQIDIQKVIEGIEKTAARGIKVHLTFTFGLPGDTVETIERTIDLACRLPCDTAQFSIATPYPGTIMYDMYKKNGWLTSENWEDYVGSTTAVSRTENFTPGQLEHYVAEAYRRFNATQLERSLRAAHFDELITKRLADSGVRAGDQVLLLQTANIRFTRHIVKALGDQGFQPVVLCHERFRPEFQGIEGCEPTVETFDHAHHFSVSELGETVTKTAETSHAKAVIAPCSNADGWGYGEVFALASSCNLPVLKLSMFGRELT